MLDPDSHKKLRNEIFNNIISDRRVLDALRSEIIPLANCVRQIKPRTTTSISIVGTDGGNNQVEYNPFLIQLIRVVDSSNNEYCLETITSSTKIQELNKHHLLNGSPLSPLGELMQILGVKSIHEISPRIKLNEEENLSNPKWVEAYREISEWAILLSIIKNKDFGSDTLIVFDGFLRSRVFYDHFFKQLLKKLANEIDKHFKNNRRKIYLIGLAKHSTVLSRYKLAMTLEGIMNAAYPCYVEIPKGLEDKAYAWNEYARGKDVDHGKKTVHQFVGVKMFFVKFGKSPHDPIWPVDIFEPQINDVQAIMGSLLADAVSGFPIPFYPLCLQKAHENAALVDFDFDILQDEILNGIRQVLGNDSSILDISMFQENDPSKHRY